MPLTELQNNFAERIYHAEEIIHFSITDKESLISSVKDSLEKYDEAVRKKIYATILHTIDYFFDDSLEKLDVQELKEGFQKFIRWELDGIKYNHEMELQDA